MSLHVVRNDLLKIKCDAIVNPTDVFLSGSGSIDKRIHDACGPLLEAELEKSSGIDVSEAIITSSYKLKTCKHIIHTIGPLYDEGNNDVFELLRNCYRNVLSVAKENKIHSIAIPLISSGTFGFPKKEAYSIAVEEINDFLADNDIETYLVVYDNESFSISKELSRDVKSYIDDNYISKHITISSVKNNRRKLFDVLFEAEECDEELDDEIIESIKLNESSKESIEDFTCTKLPGVAGGFAEEKLAFELDESFSEAVLRIIRERDLNDPDVYKKAGLDRKLFSTIRSKKNYVPSKKTAVALCIGLELDLEQTNELLKKAGLTLSHSNLFDVIIEYFIKNKKYDLYDINVVLLENDQELLGC